MTTDNSVTQADYGVGDASYRAAGGEKGIEALVERFYTLMDSLPEAAELRAMHADDLTLSKQKLVAFLCGWMGGPKRYSEQFGNITLPAAHRHLPVDMASKNSWLDCMERAMCELGYPEPFRRHLMAKFEVPAESIRLMSEFEQQRSSGGGVHYDPV